MKILITQEHIIWLLLVVMSFIIGYILRGTKTPDDGVINSGPVSFFTKNKEQQQKQQQIKIDDSKFVTEIDTAFMEKKFNSLGETTVADENVNESINKLKNFKR